MRVSSCKHHNAAHTEAGGGPLGQQHTVGHSTRFYTTLHDHIHGRSAMHSTDATRYTRRYFRSALTMTAAVGAVLSCSDFIPPDESGTFYGPVAALGAGTARSYVTLDRSGNPTDLGVALTEAGLTGLPAASTEYVVALPREASATVYKHATINWQPAGHGPGSAYALPHFDMHVYMITEAERQGIALGDAELAAKMVRQPAAEFVPAGYVPGPARVGMGMHWTDPSAPEQNGQPFTHTFFYGSYDGAFMLMEPMVTKTLLETKPAAVVTPLKLPAQYAARGYQATSYTVAWDAGAKEYRVALSGLVMR